MIDVRISSVLTSLKYIKGLISNINLKKLKISLTMGTNHNGKRNGWSYSSISTKKNIENNEHIKNVRKKLMEQKLKKQIEK